MSIREFLNWVAVSVLVALTLSCAPQRPPEPLLAPDTATSWNYTPSDSVRRWVSDHRLDTSYLHWPWDSTAPE